jgi:hypothetical protein
MFIDEGITIMLIKLLFVSNRRGISSSLKGGGGMGGWVNGEVKQKCHT